MALHHKSCMIEVIVSMLVAGFVTDLSQTSADSVATYQLTVTNMWSQASHEDWAPLFSSVRRPHFSHLGGGTHNENLTIWEEGGFSSPGMIYMQETGWIDHPDPLTVDLKSEFDQHLATGNAYSFLNYPRHFSPLEPPVSVSFEVSSTHPLVTLVSMLGPSPDWFVGVSGLDLQEEGYWREQISVDLYTHDGGTRSNDETFLCCQNGPLESPQKPISVFSDTPLADDPLRTALTGAQIGTFSFELQSVTPSATMLEAGDSDRDLDFDQLDLVRVQTAGKYLTGQQATWGEGDWNGAPGGSAEDPPAGDGLFSQLDIIAALNSGTYLTGSYAALTDRGISGQQVSVSQDPPTVLAKTESVPRTFMGPDLTHGLLTAKSTDSLGRRRGIDAVRSVTADDHPRRVVYEPAPLFLTGIPEPSSLVLALLALVPYCSAARRHKKMESDTFLANSTLWE